MVDAGMIRQVDELGRIVLPSELRERLGIHPGDGFEVFLDGDRVVLRPYRPGCVFCGEADGDMVPFRGAMVCRRCCSQLAAGGLLSARRGAAKVVPLARPARADRSGV